MIFPSTSTIPGYYYYIATTNTINNFSYYINTIPFSQVTNNKNKSAKCKLCQINKDN